jgi:cell filamentation protein
VPNYLVSDQPDAAIKNRLGATTHDELERLESRYVFARYTEIATGHGPRGGFDTAHLKAIHHHLFQDVFEWAGHTRDEKVNLSDGTVATEPLLRKVDGQPFMAGPLIVKTLDQITAGLRDANYLRGLERKEFAYRAADAMAEINAAHPFREGNGRTQRVFMEELAKQAGHDLDFAVISRERMIQASIAANERDDNSMMRRMFDEISTPARVAALTPAIEFLDQQGFPWNDRYVATMEPGHPVDVTLAGMAGGHFMARTGSGILIGRTADLPAPPPNRGEAFHIAPSAWSELGGRERLDTKQAKLARVKEINDAYDAHDHKTRDNEGNGGGRGR